MDATTRHVFEHIAKLVEVDVVALHQDLEISVPNIGGDLLDQGAGRIDDVSGSEEQFTTVRMHNVLLFGSLLRDPVAAVLKSLGEVIRLN